MAELDLTSKSAQYPAPLQMSLPSDLIPTLKFGCDEKVMQINLKTLHSLKYAVDNVKFHPYKGLKLLMHPSKNSVASQSGTQAKSTTSAAVLASFQQDKQLQKMLLTQVPMTVGAQFIREVVEKMDFTPLVHLLLMQTTYLEIAFLQTRQGLTKSQRLVQKELEQKTIQAVTTAFLKALPTELFSRVSYNQILDSKSTVEVEQKMQSLADPMKLKHSSVVHDVKVKFDAFLEEIKEPSFHWPIKYIQAQRLITALDQCWNSEEFIQYVVNYVSDILFHIVYHPRTVIHMAPWIAVDRELTRIINKQLEACAWSKTLSAKQFLDEATCTTVIDRAQSHDLIHVPVKNFVEVTRGSRVFDLDTLAVLFNEDIFQHQQGVEVPSEHTEASAAQQVLDANNEILAAQEIVSQASPTQFNSGEVSNDIVNKSQQHLQQLPPCATLTRLTKTSRITIRSAVAAAKLDDAVNDLDLTPLFTYHLQRENPDDDGTSFLSRLTVADQANTQRILVNTKSTIQGYQPSMIPLPCLYECNVTEMVNKKGKQIKRTVTKRCQNFVCSNLPVCQIHLSTLNQLGKHDKYTPDAMRLQGFELQSIPMGRDNVIAVAKPKLDLYQRQNMAISDDTNRFNSGFRKLGDLLQHCKKALLEMAQSDGTIKPFPENEFSLAYGKPSLWTSWHEFAKFAKYKVKSEGFLNVDTDDWRQYANKLREWSLNQGHLPIGNPKFHELILGKPTPCQFSDPDLPYAFTADLDPRFSSIPGKADHIDPVRRSVDSGLPLYDAEPSKLADLTHEPKYIIVIAVASMQNVQGNFQKSG